MMMIDDDDNDNGDDKDDDNDYSDDDCYQGCPMALRYLSSHTSSSIVSYLSESIIPAIKPLAKRLQQDHVLVR
jgi:hypothetical protein